jgi:L-lactate dehydrogenase
MRFGHTGVMAILENSKLAIIGAGAVGTSLAYASMIRHTATEIALYDVNTPKVEAEVLDLAHGMQFTGSSRIHGGSDLGVIEGSNVVVITAGAKQKPGESRLDLATSNARILESLVPQIVERAPDAIIMLVTNPCDVLAVVAHKISGLPASRVFASGTVLDSSRLKWLIAQKSEVSISSVHAMIVGEHGDSEFPLWSHTRIGPVPILEWMRDGKPLFTAQSLHAMAEDVVGAAYRVIAGKGATNFAIGLSGARIVEAILGDEKAVLPVSSVLDNYVGQSGVALSVPSIVDSRGVSSLVPVPFSVDETERFAKSADAVRSAVATLGYS